LTAWLAIGRLMEFSQTPASSFSTNDPSNKVNQQVQLTREEVESAKRAALADKARKLNVKPREVNLTGPELKQIKAEALTKKTRGLPIGNSLNSPPSSKADPPLKGEKKQIEKNPNKGVSKPATKVENHVDPARQQARVKLSNLRSRALKMSPVAAVEPTWLHLLAYYNYYLRLAKDWNDFQTHFDLNESGGAVQNPLRGLPDISEVPEVLRYFEVLRSTLKEQTDLPGSFSLQTDHGDSFWDRDIPSLVCPKTLTALVPNQVLDEISGTIPQ
jgi:hypothetical protein